MTFSFTATGSREAGTSASTAMNSPATAGAPAFGPRRSATKATREMLAAPATTTAARSRAIIVGGPVWRLHCSIYCAAQSVLVCQIPHFRYVKDACDDLKRRVGLTFLHHAAW